MAAPAVTLLTNFVPPYLVTFYGALAGRVARFRILVSTPMETNRSWPFQGRGLPVQVQRAITLRRTWRHPHGFSEIVSLHLPVDTLWALHRSRPDVIVTTEFGFRTLQSLVYRALRPKTRVVLWALVTETLELGRGRFREALRRWMLRRVDAVVVSGESGARYVGKLGYPDAAIFRVPPYAPPPDAPDDTPRPRSDRESRRLLYVGRLADGKGLVPWLAQLSRWAEAHPERELELWVVGDGPARAGLEARPVPKNVDVRFFGSAPYEKLVDYYGHAGILVFPTLADEWGVVVNEAFAAGVPVLGSVHSQAVEDVVEEGRTGWTFRPEREDEMASALDRALTASPGELEQMRARCLERAKGFTAESASRGMLAAIEYALAAAKPAPAS
jgi:glycosyltransferase involved in cell wall biosynthesis